ncbi:inositol polyphosphate 5-phosphatase OCRL-1 [Agrilus planipennis]|uniref:Inositol polyphosphate 5-phosphatase OCRL-1 n=1 Tax=Agrilus planipennis TaxID=224129 RepID=A0A1W4WLF9_AGRPL|nr:inositol polyphosphate 5-phosphatase OCRL-1 [Agrilus planipennis]XP_018324744.1 inositol polyphosphate 5-phosphatase OCRL-1 [Agrilus planipennis]
MLGDQNELNVVQSKFSSNELVVAVHTNALLLEQEGWVDNRRILALVKHEFSFALFVILSVNIPPVSFSDLTIERIIPLDECFLCDTEPIPQDYQNIIFNIYYKTLILPFKVEISTESSNFASEVITAKEVKPVEYKDCIFAWLDKYKDLDKIVMDLNEKLGDFPLTRQKNGQGQGISGNRESFLKYQLTLKEPEFTHQQEFTIFIGTWNVNGQPPTALRKWLSCDEEPPDIYAVGFQELDLRKEAFLWNETTREEEWQKAVMEAVHPNAKYRCVALVRLVGIQLVVLINSKHYQHVKNVAIDTVGTGILGKMGNKGGVSVRFELHNTSLCFVNSHLAAHVEEYERRNQDYHDINLRTNFRRHPLAIRDHDQVYWLGDLNYRITDLTTDQVKYYLSKSNLEPVLLADQLNQQRILCRVLQDYQEGDITFIPTYKYDLNSDIFDTSEKARAPAWTDRILWRGKGIYQSAYRSHMEMRISDHKPVSALFKSQISVIDQAKYRKVHEEVLKRMDKLENEFLPQVTIDSTEVTFELVKFREAQYKDIIIANTGQVLAEFEFIRKPNDTSYCKEWLRITPYIGCIKPGEKCDIRFEVNLEQPLEELYDILVLHLSGGKDMFITVSGKCQRSCFTTSISTLCRAPIPLLNLNPDQLQHAETQQSPVLYSVPRELWLLVDHLYRYGLKTKELFELNALNEDIVRIRDWLDWGSLDPISVPIHAVAEALLLFLSYTKDPIIPYHLHDACIAASSNYQSCKQIIVQKLPDLERNVFLYLCMFLQELLKHSNENGSDVKTLATLFGDILLRDPVRNSRPQANRGKASFLYHFLVNDQSCLLIVPNNK